MCDADFHSRNVRRCVCQSTRLWICIRSICVARKRRLDCCICSIPFSRPRVQTFVARNGFATFDLSSPTTRSAFPYIGEVSIARPPPAEKRRTTSIRAGFDRSNVCQVPRPMAGSSSPLVGILRYNIRALGMPTYDERFPYTTELELPVIGVEAEFKVFIHDAEAAAGEGGRTPAGLPCQAAPPRHQQTI